MITPEQFAGWLKEEMDKREWTRIDMAVESGLSEQTIGYMLRGQRLPTLLTFSMMLDAFDMDFMLVRRENGKCLNTGTKLW